MQEAQFEIVSAISAICPHVLYPTVGYAQMPTLTTFDNQVFTFGYDDNGYPIAPMGKTAIYPDLTSIPDRPWRAGRDYLNEGTQIRIPNNGTWSGTLYWRGVMPPGALDDTHQPILFPEQSRALIPWWGAWMFATELNRNPALAAALVPSGDPSQDPRFMRACLTWKTQFRNGGALGNWTGRQLALASQS